MVIDIHYHLEKRMVSEADLIRQMDAAGIQKTALIPIICEPVHTGGDKAMTIIRLLLRNRTLYPLARHLLTRFTTTGNPKTPFGEIRIHRQPDHEAVLAAVRAHPDRFMAWIFVNPAGNEPAITTYLRYRNHQGIIGVKAHPFWHRFPLSDLYPVVEQVEKDDKLLLLHLGFDADTPQTLLSMTQKFPKLRLILAHAAFPGYERLWKILKHRENVMVDLSAPGFVSPAIALKAVRCLGAHRCLFGSDGPYWNTTSLPQHLATTVRQLSALFPDQRERDRIMEGNAARLISGDLFPPQTIHPAPLSR